MLILRCSLLVTLLISPIAAQENSPPAIVLRLNGTITEPAKIDYDALPKLAGAHGVVCPATEELKFQLHDYLIHHDGKYWCFVVRQPGVFTRLPLDISRPMADGYFVAGIKPGEQMVTSAAALLLARQVNPSSEAE